MPTQTVTDTTILGRAASRNHGGFDIRPIDLTFLRYIAALPNAALLLADATDKQIAAAMRLRRGDLLQAIDNRNPDAVTLELIPAIAEKGHVKILAMKWDAEKAMELCPPLANLVKTHAPDLFGAENDILANSFHVADAPAETPAAPTRRRGTGTRTRTAPVVETPAEESAIESAVGSTDDAPLAEEATGSADVVGAADYTPHPIPAAGSFIPCRGVNRAGNSCARRATRQIAGQCYCPQHGPVRPAQPTNHADWDDHGAGTYGAE